MEIGNFFETAIGGMDVGNNYDKCIIPLHLKSGADQMVSVNYLKSHPDQITRGAYLTINDTKYSFMARNKVGEFVFVSDNVVGISSINKLNSFLDKLEESFPEELLDLISECEHLTGGRNEYENGYTNGRKLWILSNYNVDNYAIGSGKDDVCLGMMLGKGKQRAPVNGGNMWYWLDTPFDRSLWKVSPGGGINNNNSESIAGVVTAFSI